MKRDNESNPFIEILPFAAIGILMLRILEGERKMEKFYKFIIGAVVVGYFFLLVGLILVLTMRFAHGA